jgi:hypothetical protein
MSQGDEYAEGGPPPSGRKGDEAAARWGDDDDLPIKKSGRSGMVTAVGIIGIIFGALGLITGVCGGISVACVVGGGPWLQEQMKKAGAPQDPNLEKGIEQAQSLAGITIADSIVSGLRGVFQILGGILVLRRSNIGRYLTIAMAVIGVLTNLLFPGIMLAMGRLDMTTGIFAGVILALFIPFAGFACFVLLTPKLAAEFRGQ